MSAVGGSAEVEVQMTPTGDGQLVARADELPLLCVRIVSRHGSLGSVLTPLGVGIVLESFARADKFPLIRVGIVSWRGSLRSILTLLGVRIVLQRNSSSRDGLVPTNVRIISRLRLRRC